MHLPTPTECVSGAIRLVNGPTPIEGRVEVCSSDNNWGLVCDDFWDNNDGTVACRQLGLLPEGTMATTLSLAQYGRGTGQFILDNLRCTGTEASLFDCTHNGEGNHNCVVGREEAGVQCPASEYSVYSLHTLTCSAGA